MAAIVDERVQHEEHGGFHFGAAFFGWLVATGVEVLLVALLTAIGSAVALTAFNTTQGIVSNAPTVGIVGAILLVAALAIAYYTGGYVAGRLTRFDGARQGVGVWVLGIGITIILAILGSAFGTNYNLLQQLNVPHIPINQGDFTTGGGITLLVAIVATGIAAALGGKVGEQYHRRIDATGYAQQPANREAGTPAEPTRSERRTRRQPAMTFGETVNDRDSRDIRRREEER